MKIEFTDQVSGQTVVLDPSQEPVVIRFDDPADLQTHLQNLDRMKVAGRLNYTATRPPDPEEIATYLESQALQVSEQDPQAGGRLDLMAACVREMAEQIAPHPAQEMLDSELPETQSSGSAPPQGRGPRFIGEGSPTTIRAPWTSEEVDSLNNFQQYGNIHPFTCRTCGYTLRAYQDGWWCTNCNKRRQLWAHWFMFESADEHWASNNWGRLMGQQQATTPDPAEGKTTLVAPKPEGPVSIYTANDILTCTDCGHQQGVPPIFCHSCGHPLWLDKPSEPVPTEGA
jgi:rubrerythrin